MSTKVDNLGAIGWKPQQPYVISGADYKLGPDYEGHIGVPVELDTALGTSGVDTDDQNKRWVKPYASATSATVALGVMFKELGAKGNAYERRLGRGGYRRDLALLQFGIIPILNYMHYLIWNLLRLNNRVADSVAFQIFRKDCKSLEILKSCRTSCDSRFSLYDPDGNRPHGKFSIPITN